MRFMMLRPAAAEALEACTIPDKDLVNEMRKYDEEMTKAGVLFSNEGLHPSSRGTRIKILGGKRVITDGPFTESKELIAGFWIIQVKSKEEALVWAERCPLPEHGLLEIRQIFRNPDFPAAMQKKMAEA